MNTTALLDPLLAVVISTGLAFYLAPILIRAAHRYGIVDRPSTALKTHTEPVPYLGGLVVFIAMLVAVAVTFPFSRDVLALLLFSSITVAVGLVDDLGTLTPRDKILGQILAAAVLVKSGVHIEVAFLPFPVGDVLSVLWLITCMNAFNILDVSDGLAASAGVVGASAAVAVALLNGDPMIATMGAALLGGCLGFLYFNREPARMYLGDTGSLVIGANLGALALIGRYSESNQVSALFVPLTLLAAPLFDLLLVIIARIHARRPIWHGSPDHYAVRLRHHGWSARAVARLTLALGALVAAVGIGSTFLPDTPALLTAASTIAVGMGLLGVIMWRFPPRALPATENAIGETDPVEATARAEEA